ncbi:type IV conjugative transfer system pilin TraA [Vibrio parahaemolyticus]|uniref:Pilin n=1 Tax=Vibrio parahaemolyticus TaxID=670 RepID=A0AA47JNC0_VIBPH|nr:type IV conjugative transfer system pilin TraA [Vibrio parahaemolyticus]MCR9648298.1 hypothetical protein [Vibrio parahaemolyticus]MCR9801953.1 hypothetical protein [Vibrio parahaemolyticus]MDF4921108.1 type IV conjugative transfer system pilin TraA [Vibrio parahaemolyticus]MDF5667528.1 type IV conjugative transfer system pilin TraA [Vibrio parahaemolyticus]MDG3059043.1 type IV conjugative transfer system pilin TraA [Vibrio parahaemolyticus]
MNTKTSQPSFMLRAYVFIAAWLASICPAFATDLFASGKTTVTNTVGSGSSGEFYILVAGLIGGIIVGIIQKNWVGGIIGFFVGVVFWEVGKSFVGL